MINDPVVATAMNTIRLDEVLMQTNDMPWRPKSLKGVSEKILGATKRRERR